jgi:diguanylate cyclase
MMKAENLSHLVDVPGSQLARQFVFIKDDRLQEAPVMRSLVRAMPPAQAETPCDSVMARFLDDPAIYALPVVDGDGKPVALVDRKGYIEFFTKPYSREIFGRDGILDFLQSGHYHAPVPIIVEDYCSVEDAAQIIIASGIEHLVTGFLVTSHGQYLGVANGHDLLNLITQRKQAELYYMAHYDHLTGVPNRALLNDRITQACLDADRKGHQVALLFIDIDRFKQINDSLGHRAGDAVLSALVGRLKAVARKSDTVARIGGDEFIILMEDLAHSSDADIVARRLVESMLTPFSLLGHSLVVTVSIGIAIYPTDDVDISRLLAKADSAMYEAKAGGRNGFRSYSLASAGYNPSRLSLENDLRQAIERNELSLVYQPQVDFANNRIQGVEALLRWQHPVRGPISPMQFIPLAEESGYIIQLGEWVMRRAFRQIAEWRSQGLPPLRMAINISAVQFHQGSFADQLMAAMQDYAIDPGLIELELTESVLMHNVEAVLATLNRIKAQGIRLAIDDFGTGYSSLNYLRRFPIDRLKIDQSFVRDIEQTPANESITRSIIALAESLSLEVVAEGIEKESERLILKKLGCLEGQGYFFDRPLAPGQLAERLAGWVKAADIQAADSAAGSCRLAQQ